MSKIGWQIPRHRINEASEERKINWLELFYDLIFVVIIFQISHRLSEHPGLQGALYFVVQFAAVWIIWVVTTYYNNRFEGEDFRHVFFMYLLMLPMLGIACAVNELTYSKIKIFILCYTAVRLILLYLWYTAGRADQSFSRNIGTYSIGHVLSISVWILSLFVPREMVVYVWIIAVVIDILLPALTMGAFTELPEVSFSHMTERFALFMMIGMGEVIITMIRTFAEEEIFDLRTVVRVAIGFTVVFLLCYGYIDGINRRSFRPEAKYMYFWWMLHLPLMIGIMVLSNRLSFFIDSTSIGIGIFGLSVSLTATVLIMLLLYFVSDYKKDMEV